MISLYVRVCVYMCACMCSIQSGAGDVKVFCSVLWETGKKKERKYFNVKQI